MAINRWEPKAANVAQVDTVTVALTWATNDSVALTINGKTLTVTIGETSPTTATVATAIKEAWENDTFTDPLNTKTPASGGQDSTLTEFGEITATVSGSVVTLTHDTAGRPFTLSVVETTAGNGTATEATATAATGVNDVNNAANWSNAAVPTTGDTVYVDNTDISLLYSLDQLTNTVTSLTIGANFTGDIGLPKTTDAGYTEYLPDYLAMPATTVKIGVGTGNGSSRIKLDNGSVQTAWNVESSGFGRESGIGAVVLKGTHASNTLEVLTGSVSVAPYGGEVATIATVTAAAGEIELGAGCTLTTVTNNAGSLRLNSAATTVTNNRGTVRIDGSGAITTLNANGGTTQYNSSGTITTLNAGGPRGAVVDFSGDNSTRTVSTFNVESDCVIIDPHNTVSKTLVLNANVGSAQFSG